MEKLCPIDNTPQCPGCPGKRACLEKQLKLRESDYYYSCPIGLDDEEARELAESRIQASRLG